LAVERKKHQKSHNDSKLNLIAKYLSHERYSHVNVAAYQVKIDPENR